MSNSLYALALTVFTLVAIACGPSQSELDRLIDERVGGILSAIPSPTPIVLPTPLPTSTPVTFPTPLPTPTPMPTPTPTIIPTHTPFPPIVRTFSTPTPTPVRFPTRTPEPVVFPGPTDEIISSLGIDFANVYSQALMSVFIIETSFGTGSGWLVEPNLIVTNQHVVGDVSTATVHHAWHGTLAAVVVGVDIKRDIALLRFDISKVPEPSFLVPLKLGQIPNRDLSHSLMILGYSGKLVYDNGDVVFPTAKLGSLSSIARSNVGDFSGWNLLIRIKAEPGNSGGPVLNNAGEVVGMTRAVGVGLDTSDEGEVQETFAVTVDDIKSALLGLKLLKP